MIRFLLPFAAAIAVVLAGWLMLGFIAWNWDTSTWDTSGRLLLLVCTLPFAVCAFAITKDELP